MKVENLAQMLRERCKKDPDRTAYLVKKGEQWEPITWSETDDRVEKIAGGLISLGIKPGDTVCILGDTSLEWSLADLAVLRTAAVSVGIYPTLSGEQSAYILKDSNAKILFTENGKKIDKIKPYLEELPDLKWIITWDDSESGSNLISLDELMVKGEEALAGDSTIVANAETAIKPSDMAIIVYTSGTTGPPKGACMSHANVIGLLDRMSKVLNRETFGDTWMSFLPLAHVAERCLGLYLRIYFNLTGAFIDDINKVIDSFGEIKPKYFGSVPRIFEKAYDKIQAEVANSSPFKQKMFRWAENVGREVSRHKQKGQTPPVLLNMQYTVADKLVLSKIRQIFGGEARNFSSGAAPISLEILEFFHACGMLITEVYGQTESTAILTVNNEDDYRFGSVGKPLPDMEVKISDEGEILARGGLVFMGYKNQPELTAQTVDEDGWLHTGDIGKFDEDGFLYITGRIKEIIITSGGKNITPSNIENQLKNYPLIDQVMVHGDKRKYLTALVGLGAEQLEVWAKDNNCDGLCYEELTKHNDLKNEVQEMVDEVNKNLGRHETIKKFSLLPAPLEVETGEMTPTLKVRRKIVEEKYRELLDSMYD